MHLSVLEVQVLLAHMSKISIGFKSECTTDTFEITILPSLCLVLPVIPD